MYMYALLHENIVSDRNVSETKNIKYHSADNSQF